MLPKFPIAIIYWILNTLYIYTYTHIHSLVYTNYYLILFKFFIFLLFRATHAAYRGSQARGPIGAVAARLHHRATAMQDPSHVCDQHHSSWQCHHSSWQPQLLNLLSRARDRTHNLTVPSQIRFCCTTTGTPILQLLLTALIVHRWKVCVKIYYSRQK